MKSPYSRRTLQSSALLATTLLCAILSEPAKATPPANALFGTINGQSVAIYAGDSAFGTCLQGEAQATGQPWTPVFTLECGIDQGKLDAHGGSAGYVTYLLPDINLRLTTYFGGGGDVKGQLNSALTTAFRISNGQLVPK